MAESAVGNVAASELPSPDVVAHTLIELARGDTPASVTAAAQRLKHLGAVNGSVASHADNWSLLAASHTWGGGQVSVGGRPARPITAIDLVIWEGRTLDEAQRDYARLLHALSAGLGKATMMNQSGHTESWFWQVPVGDLELFLYAEDEATSRGRPHVQAHIAFRRARDL